MRFILEQKNNKKTAADIDSGFYNKYFFLEWEY